MPHPTRGLSQCSSVSSDLRRRAQTIRSYEAQLPHVVDNGDRVRIVGELARLRAMQHHKDAKKGRALLF